MSEASGEGAVSETYLQAPEQVAAEAVDAAERDWAVIAVERRRYKDGRWGWPQFGPATRDPTEVAKRFAPGGGWHGKAAGYLLPDGDAVVDIDPHKGGSADGLDLPETWTESTPNGGDHYEFQLPAHLAERVADESLSSFKLRKGVDILCRGGHRLADPDTRGPRQPGRRARMGIAASADRRCREANP